MNNNEETIFKAPIDDFDDVGKPQNTKHALTRLILLLAMQKKEIILILFTVIISVALFAATPLILGSAIDLLVNHITSHGFTSDFSVLSALLGKTIGILLFAYITSSALTYVQEYFMASIGEKLTLTIRKQMSLKMTKLPLKYFDSHQTGDVLSRVTNDLDKVAEILKIGLLHFATSTLNITISLVIMMFTSPTLTMIVLITLSISIAATGWISGKSFTASSDNQATIGELNSRIEEYYSGNLIIKSFNQQKEVIDIVAEVSERQYKANRKAQFVVYAIYPLILFLTQITFVTTAILGGIFVVNGTMTIGMVQAFLQYVNQVSEPITSSSYFLSSLQAALAAVERVFEFLDEEEEPAESITPKHIINPNGNVEFKNVKFGYSSDKTLMHDVNFCVKPNEMVAIVGPTGAGKTTLINLLMRFYELHDGKILIDGIDIKELPKGELRKMVGMVLQDTWLFEGTIAENIAYGKMNATHEEIVLAAKAARCDHVIRTLKDGYNTIISSENSSLSQGEVQLLTIARAMLANPTLMILDEATSSVDTRTEVEIQKAMKKIMEGKTSFVIAHRLSTIKSANIILVMNNGDIIEKGTHEELLNQNGFYADLYNSQFGLAM